MCSDHPVIANENVKNLPLQPPLSDERLELIDQAFDKMDHLGTGEITVDDLKGVYSAEWHPKFQDGSMTEEEVFTLFLQQFGGDEDGVVRKKEANIMDN